MLTPTPLYRELFMPTKKQVYRWYCQLWEHTTRYDGYQPFGYDERTLRITRPGFLAARDRLAEMFKTSTD